MENSPSNGRSFLRLVRSIPECRRSIGKHSVSQRCKMPRFKVAHLREQGGDLVIIPLESSFGNKSSDEQHQIMQEFQAHSRAAGQAAWVRCSWSAVRKPGVVCCAPLFPPLSLGVVWVVGWEAE